MPGPLSFASSFGGFGAALHETYHFDEATQKTKVLHQVMCLTPRIAGNNHGMQELVTVDRGSSLAAAPPILLNEVLLYLLMGCDGVAIILSVHRGIGTKGIKENTK